MKNPIKVLHINSEKSWRGGEQQMSYLIEELQKIGVKNYICCRKNSSLEDFSKKKKIPSLSLSFSGLKFINSLSLKNFVTKHKIDIIHTHSSNAHTLAYYANICGMDIPIVVSKRTDFPIRNARKYNIENVKAVLCVSEKIKEITLEKIKRNELVQTVYSGINPDRFDVAKSDLRQRLGLSNSSILIGNCSAIADQKDYFTFVKVAKTLPQFHFVIIGSGPLEGEIKKFVADEKLTNVHFTGFLDDIENYLHSLDVFLITSKTEGLGTSILDAMICRVPVVATKAGGIPEIVKNEATGILCEIGNVDQLKSGIELVLSNDEIKTSIIDNAYNNVLHNFSKKSTASKTFEIYESILN